MSMTWRQAEQYDAQMTLLRQLINTSARFELHSTDGPLTLVDGRLRDEECLRIDGSAAPDLARHLFHLNYYALMSLLGLLEAARGTKAEPNAVELLRSLKLDQDPLQAPSNR